MNKDGDDVSEMYGDDTPTVMEHADLLRTPLSSRGHDTFPDDSISEMYDDVHIRPKVSRN